MCNLTTHIPTPYHLATQRAAALYVPGHPTEAWREACREAERAWVEMRHPKQQRAVQDASQARAVGAAKGTKR